MFEKYVGKNTKVRMERKFSSDIYANGFIHWLGEEILCAQVFHDFYCEGYSIYRKNDILNVRSNEYERFFEKILIGEGLMAQISPPSIARKNTISEVLEHFKSNGQNIVIECEFEGGEEDIFA